MWSFKTALFYHWGDMKYWSRSDYAHGLGASKLKNSILALPNNNKNSEHSIYNFLSGRGKNFCDFSVRPSVRPSVATKHLEKKMTGASPTSGVFEKNFMPNGGISMNSKVVRFRILIFDLISLFSWHFIKFHIFYNSILKFK